MKKIIVSFVVFIISGLLVIQGETSLEFNKVMNSRRADQKKCSGVKQNFSMQQRSEFIKQQEALLKHPVGKKYLGNHENGRKLFIDSKRGNCYACHCGEASEVACGNIGPSLKNFADTEMDPDFVFQRIYNSWSIMPCSVMPRFGVHNQLSVEEIADVTAYLLDKSSALNQKEAK